MFKQRSEEMSQCQDANELGKTTMKRKERKQKTPRHNRPVKKGAPPVHRRRTPNFFFAARFQDEQVIQAIVQLQRRLLAKEPALSKYMIKSPKLHVTLFVLCAESPSMLQKARLLASRFFEEELRLADVASSSPSSLLAHNSPIS